jgi:hypothetical protein
VNKRVAIRYVLLPTAAFLISAPLSVVVTFLLTPFWRWLEATRGIESIGHSGPAEWCYVAVFVVLAACLGVVGGVGLGMARRRAGT